MLEIQTQIAQIYFWIVAFLCWGWRGLCNSSLKGWGGVFCSINSPKNLDIHRLFSIWFFLLTHVYMSHSSKRIRFLSHLRHSQSVRHLSQSTRVYVKMYTQAPTTPSPHRFIWKEKIIHFIVKKSEIILSYKSGMRWTCHVIMYPNVTSSATFNFPFNPVVSKLGGAVP